MRPACISFLIGLLVVLNGTETFGQEGLPSATVSDGLGVNIHFTDPRPGEMKMLAAGGFRCVRIMRLERIGSLEANAILEPLAKGAPGTREMEEAKASLERLKWRGSTVP